MMILMSMPLRLLKWAFGIYSPSLGRAFTFREALLGKAGRADFDDAVDDGIRKSGLQ